MHSPLILASGSPRRKDILVNLGFDFSIVIPDVDESLRDREPPRARVVGLAEDKARAAELKIRGKMGGLILAADTLVCVPGDGAGEELVLGKPADREDARRMLRSLHGRAHWVHTGLALLDSASGRLETIRSDSEIRFAAMSEEEIEDYLDYGEWEGVAGGYRIQERAALYIEEIRGSWSGIVGLPIRELYVILRRFNRL